MNSLQSYKKKNLYKEGSGPVGQGMRPPLLKGQEKKWRTCIWTLVNRSVPPPPTMRGRREGKITRYWQKEGIESHEPGRVRVPLMIQKILDINGKTCTVLWDMGAQILCITQQHSRDAGFKGCPTSILILDVESGNKKKSWVQYRVLLRKIDESVAEFRLDRITGDAVGIDLSKAKKTFPATARDLESPDGLIHLVNGMDYIDDAPKEQERRKSLVLYRPVFGTA
jgi:hypothetical protein